MTKWNIKFILKSGANVTGVYTGTETNSGGVAEKFLLGDPNTFNGFLDATGTHNILVNNSDIAAIDISLRKE